MGLYADPLKLPRQMIGCDNPSCPYEWFHYSKFGPSIQLPINEADNDIRLRRAQAGFTRQRHVVLSLMSAQDAKQQYEATAEVK
jgi:hypothetical protein